MSFRGMMRGLPEREGKGMEIWYIEGDRVVEDDGDGEGVSVRGLRMLEAGERGNEE